MEAKADAYRSSVVVLSHFLGGGLINLAKLMELRVDEIVKIMRLRSWLSFEWHAPDSTKIAFQR